MQNELGQQPSRDVAPGTAWIMTQANQRFVVAYVLLVGIPLLGLLGALRLGRYLTAPTSVDGVWEISEDPEGSTPDECAESTDRGRKMALTISQSGSNLVASLSSDSLNTADGQIADNTITIPSLNVTNPDKNNCGKGRLFSLVATVSQATSPAKMDGLFVAQGCDSCRSLRFSAVRRSSNGERGRQ